ncbi:hypothetical protein [uncultured Treponema sp.]|uniref:hypothetical protein n=1 Tax=uncultured Treponema sp. TaxID=162155 RepID=UPI0015BAA08C|nr:hypothetical protein [uncultured Treponema sp.]
MTFWHNFETSGNEFSKENLRPELLELKMNYGTKTHNLRKSAPLNCFNRNLTDIKMRQGMEPWLCLQSQCAAPKVTERRNTRRHLCRGAQIKKIRTFEQF